VTLRGWLALGAGLTVIALAHGVMFGVGPHDESWFLRVVDRVADGDVLYRDVFFPSTPLAVWLALGPVALLGAELLVLKAIAAAVHAAAGLAVAGAARALGFTARTAVVLATLCVVVPGLRGSSVYSGLAIALTLGALAAILRWDPAGPSRRPLVAAGALAGLALATKHNVGGCAVLALAVAVPVLGGRAALRRAVPAAALATAAGALLPFVPVLITGGGPRLLEYAVTAKGTYADRAGVSYLDGIGNGVTAWADVRGSGTFEEALLQACFLALPLAALGLAIAIARAAGDDRRRLIVVGLFGAAVVAVVYPRADSAHVGAAIPAIVLWLAIAWRDLLPRGVPRRSIAWAACALAALLGALALARPPARLIDGSTVLSDVPHFRAVLVSPEQRDRMRADRRDLRAAARRHRPILTLGSSAGYAQLLGELESPTPYDYPLVTALGKHGEEETARAVRDGAIRAACITPSDEGLAAERLEAAVRETLTHRTRLRLCTLYTR
jgi:hypothetical protein